MTTSTSNNTFHLFPRPPCELRILIWELAVSPRIVDIYANPHFKKDHPTNCRVWSLSSSELFTLGHDPIAALHACQEARNHLTHPARAKGYYEKVSVECVVKNAQEPRTKGEIDDPYTWVNFEIDMIDIGDRRLTLSAHYASKIRRLKFKVTLFSQPVLEVLTPGKYDCSPNVKEVEIDCPGDIEVVFSRIMAWKSMKLLLGRMKLKDWICIADPLGKRMTFKDAFDERLRAARERREPVYALDN